MQDLQFDFDFKDFNLNLDETIDKKQNEKEEKKIAVSHKMGHRHLSRKAASEKALEDQLNWHFQEGDCYHCFSFGDVDSMSFFKHILRMQKIEYAAISTWCMAGEDIKDMEQWYRRGMIGRVDFYLGEIFPGSYPEAYELAKKFCRECGGKVVIFRNHSKVMIIKGETFDCLIESSANVNTNPRSENTVITVDRSLVEDYIQLFSGIKSFEKDFEDVQPYRIRGK